MVSETRLAPKIYIAFGAGDSHGGEGHGVLAIQSLQVWSHTCVTSQLHPLLHAFHTYRLYIAPVIFTIV